MRAKDIEIILFEDNKDIREGVQMILNASPGFSCNWAFADCSHLLKRLHTSNPDVVLMDIQMPGISGIEAVAELRNEFPHLPVLMQTVFEDDAKVFAAVCAGANGYILKTTPPVKLLEAIKEVLEGGSPMTPSIATKVLKMFKEQNLKPQTGNYEELTQREKEILSLLSEGLSYKMIAHELCIKTETVHSHIKKIYYKLHVSSATEAIGKALRNRVL